jgi:hypothetical protein
VFLYKFGKRIFDKIQEAMEPEFADEEKINPFDFWSGANFKLKVRKVAGFINYDKSEFDSLSELFSGDDTKLEELWKKQYPLKPFTDPSNFKSYDELKERLSMVIGDDIRFTDVSTNTVESVQMDQEETPASTPDVSAETDAMDYFSKLSQE